MTKRLITGRTSGMFIKSPVVRFAQVDGSTFTGKMISSRETKFGLGFEMGVISGTAPIQISNEDKIWSDVDVAVGDTVTVLTSKDGQLETKLKQVKIGETAEIIFKGKVLNPKSGRRFNDFEVSVIE